MASGTFYPSVSVDDGYISYSGVHTSGYNFLILGSWGGYYNNWIRFQTVTIPQGATITEAYVKLTAETTNSGTVCNVNCYFNDVDNAVAPINTAEYNALALTGAVVWNGLSAWTNGTQYNTPSLVSILQDIIDRVGFSSGNAVQLLIKDNASDTNAYRRASSIDYSSGSEKAELHVTWASDTEITLPNPFSSETSLQSNIQIELVPGALSAEASMSIGEPFWGSYVELPQPFSAEGSLQAKTGLDIALTPLVAQSNLQSNLQVELVAPSFTAQSELSIGEVFWGYLVYLPEPFSTNVSLQANTQIEIVTAPLIATSALLGNIGIEVSAGALNATGAILVTPHGPVQIIGAPGVKRVYLFTLTGEADGVNDIIIPISSFQSSNTTVYWGQIVLQQEIRVVYNWIRNRLYLSVVIPGLEYVSDINDRLNGDLVLRMGYVKEKEILLTNILARVDFESIRIDEGVVNKSITLDGYAYELRELGGQTINLGSSSYKSINQGSLRCRCTPNLYLKPGDIAITDDDSFTVKSITCSISPELETYEIAE